MVGSFPSYINKSITYIGHDTMRQEQLVNDLT